MRAAVQQAEELAVDVEHRDRAFVDGEEFSRARRQLLDGCNDVAGHEGMIRGLSQGRERTSPLPWERSNCQRVGAKRRPMINSAIRVRGSGLSRERNPSPGSPARSDLSLRER